VYERILVPFDGSPTSKKGLQEAMHLGKALGSRLRVLHVVENPVMLDFTGMANIGDVLDVLRRTGQELLASAQALARQQGIDADTALVEERLERVADVVIRHAREWSADLIVMGTHGRRGVSHLLLGSDAEGVIRLSPVPVLLVRLQEQADSVP
jgi:nucleotide-binding universal stress UspA family protein